MFRPRKLSKNALRRNLTSRNIKNGLIKMKPGIFLYQKMQSQRNSLINKMTLLRITIKALLNGSYNTLKVRSMLNEFVNSTKLRNKRHLTSATRKTGRNESIESKKQLKSDLSNKNCINIKIKMKQTFYLSQKTSFRPKKKVKIW